MHTRMGIRWLGVVISLALIATFSLEGLSHAKHPKRKRQHTRGNAMLWRDPGNIRHRDLYYGPGSKDLEPQSPFRFIKEIKEGSNPKFEVVDARV